MVYAKQFQIDYQQQFDQAEVIKPILKRLHYQDRPPVLATILMQDTLLAGHISKLQVFAPVFPTLARQTIENPTLLLQPAPTNGYPHIIEEGSDRHNKLFVALADMPFSQNDFTVTLQAKLTLKKIKLVDLKPDEPAPDVPPLTTTESNLYLQPTRLFNFDSNDFQTWLEANNLHPHYLETRLDFAARVYQFIQTHFTYYYSNDLIRIATNTIQTGKTDCGGFSILYGAILRYHGIPARALVGRWAGIGDDDKDCECHVKSEFYLAHIGWVPVDVTSGVTDHQQADDLRHFGRDSGQFLAMHIDPELVLETMYGPKRPTVLQGFSYWVRSKDKLIEKNYEMWSVHPTN